MLISCDQLGRVTLATLSTSDEQSVCARLESLEARMTKMCETVTKAQANQLHVTQAFANRNVPNVVVTPVGNGGVPSVYQPHGYAAAVCSWNCRLGWPYFTKSCPNLLSRKYVII